jgi:hypothetical protein
MKIALTGIALAMSLALAGVAAPVDAQSGGYRGGPPSGGAGGGGYRGGPPQGGGYRGGPPPATGFRGAPPPATWRSTWHGPGWNGWHGGARPWGPAWRPGWGWGGWGWGWNGWGWGTGWGPGWGWGVGWNPGWGWGPGFWGWGAGAPVVVATSTIPVWAPPFEPTVYVERERAATEVPPAPAAEQWWYWCTSARGYYPYVGACPEGWQRVAPQVPSAPQ